MGLVFGVAHDDAPCDKQGERHKTPNDNGILPILKKAHAIAHHAALNL
ncbi:hypothetical protein [Myxacorys almedinensis]|uniref:Uncharacterized protein n=1 Tax=Myxacorys almedinensis A TaxID=2690445 RepID=A0A8J7YWA9_9CYAN|nr:hypothetical protein [Myxacorys almedinensis]NDJ15852.1 hypothetical protein [Myxacorys almedinensis A]